MATDPEKMPLDEYLILEERSEVRHEYIDGQLRAMTGATRRHAQLITNLCWRAKTAAATRCEIYVAGMMLRIETGNRMYYPDLVGCCDPADNDDRYLIRPCFVVEVLSHSTARIDRREKLAAYFTLPSVEQYAVVEQDCMRIEVYQRERGPFSPDVLEMPDDILELSCINLRVALKDVYDGVALPPLEVRRPQIELPDYAES